MSTLKVSTISPLGTDATKTITIGSGANGDVAAGIFTNTPAFEAYLSSDQTGLADNTFVKVQFDTVSVDTDSGFDNTTNYRYTVPTGKGGKYLLYGSIGLKADADNELATSYTAIYKNASLIRESKNEWNTNYIRCAMQSISIVMDLSAGDYVELYGVVNRITGAVGGRFEAERQKTFFGGYKLIGV